MYILGGFLFQASVGGKWKSAQSVSSLSLYCRAEAGKAKVLLSMQQNSGHFEFKTFSRLTHISEKYCLLSV